MDTPFGGRNRSAINIRFDTITFQLLASEENIGDNRTVYRVAKRRGLFDFKDIKKFKLRWLILYRKLSE